jgi:hypothetical protein
MADNKPLTPAQRQTFVDSLPAEQRNAQPKQTFEKLIASAAKKPTVKSASDKKPKK